MTTIEHKELKGITVKNLVVTVLSTASIVASVMTTYFQLKDDIQDIRMSQNAQTRVNEIRLKILEGQVTLLQQEVDGLKSGDLRLLGLKRIQTKSIKYSLNKLNL